MIQGAAFYAAGESSLLNSLHASFLKVALTFLNQNTPIVFVGRLGGEEKKKKKKPALRRRRGSVL